jgi:outer membrane murein-binding lipoprotein Lpp
VVRPRKRFTLVILAVLAVVTAALTLAGCSNKSQEQYRDAGIAHRNDGKADVMTFPDGFSNVAAKCDGPNRVYVAFKGDANRAAIAVSPNDPQCAGTSSPG